MPYSGPSDKELPSNVKDMPENARNLWVRTWNSTYSKSKDEALAFKTANAVCKKMMAREDDITDDELESAIAAELEPRPGRSYLIKLRDMLKGLKGQAVDDSMIDSIVRKSAGHAGGIRHRKASEAGDLLDLCADLFCEECDGYEDQEIRFFNEFNESVAPDYVNVLPVPGTYKHPKYGDIKITKERNARFVNNFNGKVYQEKVPVDAEHETKLSGALGWITSLRQNEDGSVDAQVDWEERGKSAIEDGRFKYFSPEWYDTWKDPIGGKSHSDVLIGGALTTRPFFKERALKPLVASEMQVLDASWQQYKEVPNNLSFDDIRMKLNDHIRKTSPKGMKDLDSPWITDIFSDHFVWFRDGVYLSNSYEVEEDGSVRISEEAPKTVQRFTFWRPISATEPGSEPGAIVNSEPVNKEKKAVSEVTKEEFVELQAKFAEVESSAKASEAALAEERERREAAEKRVSNLESEAQRSRFAEIVKTPSPWYGDPEKHVARLMKLSEAFGEDSDVFQEYVADQRAQAEQLSKSEIFKEIGSTQTATTPSGFSGKLEKFREENPSMSESEATEVLLAQDPNLYNEYRRSLLKRVATAHTS